MRAAEVRGELTEAAQRIALLAADPAWIAGLSPAERRSVGKVLSGANEARAHAKFYDLFPPAGPFRRELYPRQMEHFRAGATHRERCLMGGNRTGKTLSGAYELTAHLTGDYPEWWDGRRFDEPGHYWAAGKQNQTVRDIIQAELFGAVIKDANNRNVIAGGAMVPGASILPATAAYRGGYPRLLDTVGITASAFRPASSASMPVRAYIRVTDGLPYTGIAHRLVSGCSRNSRRPDGPARNPGGGPFGHGGMGERRMPRKSTLKLSRRVVEALAVESGDRVFYDRDLTGFGVRVHASGRKVYVVHARAPGGALKRAAIGRKVDITVEDARRVAAEVIDRLKKGEEAFPQPPAPEATVADLARSAMSRRIWR